MADQDAKYKKLLWEHAFMKAEIDKRKKTKRDVGSDEILKELYEQSKLPESTIRGWKCNPDRGLATKTIVRLLEYLKIDSFLHFKEFIDSEEKKKGNVYLWIKEIVANDSFLKTVYSILGDSPVLGNNDTSLSHDQTILFFKLIEGIKEVYNNEAIFKSLYLVADNSGILGNLSMDDYFIQLSYVTQAEIKTRESIIRSETEINKHKLQRAAENYSQLTKDYVINFSLKKGHNLLILGSPGIGKSTYSRWLSHRWSCNPDVLGGNIPIYIQLKGIEFQNNINPIVSYIRRNYLSEEISPENLQSLLRKASSVFCFILDGYDELGEKSKENLFYRLQEISSNNKYILTSRPYGVLNTYGLRCDQMIQLDGFDSSNINNYIDVFLKKNNGKKGKTKENLLEIIRTNPTLSDFSHNPLMLSFIVYIYLAEDHVEETFKNIQTRFDLQETVISWMYTHNKQKISVRMNKYLFDSVSLLAYSMEVDKVPEITGSTLDGKVMSVLIPISKLGIGQYRCDNYHSYKFSFSSITFQEYFAALHIGTIITSRAFNYLLQDSYFWNLAAMLIGKLNRNEDYVILNNLLTDCKNEILEHSSYHSYYKYLLLLGECSSKYLSDHLEPQSLITVYTAYKLNINNDRIKYSVTEYIQRFYRKISFVNKNEFKALIIADLKKAGERELVNWKGIDPYYYIRTIVSDLDLALDNAFVETCLDILIAVMKMVNKNKEKYLKIVNAFEVPRLPEAILSFLNSALRRASLPVNIFSKFDTVKKLLLMHHLKYKAEIDLVQSQRIDDVVSKLEKSIIYVTKVEHDERQVLTNFHLLCYFKPQVLVNKNIPNLVSWVDAIGDIAIFIFLLGSRHREFAIYKNEEQRNDLMRDAIRVIRNFIINANKLDENGTLQGKNNHWFYIAFVDQVAQLTATGLLMQNDSSDYFKTALDILSELSYSSKTAKVDQLSINFEKLLNDIDVVQNLKYVHLSLLHVPALKNKISKYRGQLFKLVDEFIETHQDAFHENSIVTATGGELHPIEVLDPFFSLLNSDPHSSEIIYESDKRFFVTQFIDSKKGSYTYLRNVLMDIVNCDFILYDLPIWNYILQSLNPKEKRDIENVLRIYTNLSIYQYVSNTDYLLKFLNFLIDIESRPYYASFIRKNSDLLFVVAANSLLMVKKTPGIDVNKKEEIVYIISRILKHKALSQQYRKNYADSLFATMLLYYFTKDVESCQLIQYSDSQENNQLIENVYSAFNLSMDIALIGKFGGSKFVKEVNEYHEQVKVYHFPFKRLEFESFCAKQ